jgi:hypothetical protein
MSDFSGLEQSFALPAMSPSADLRMPDGGILLPEARERSYDVVLDEVGFVPLHAADEIQAIQKMRAEIQLPGTAMADPGFHTREKKETGRGLSVRSNGMVTSSAP